MALHPMIAAASGNAQSDVVVCQKYGAMMVDAARQRADAIKAYATGQKILDASGLAACSDALIGIEHVVQNVTEAADFLAKVIPAIGEVTLPEVTKLRAAAKQHYESVVEIGDYVDRLIKEHKEEGP
jgi:hypothetical protein